MSPLLCRLVCVLLLAAGCQRPDARVVVYCAQDQEFAEGVFADFTKGGGPTVVPKYDTEANKSVSLAGELRQEAGRPRCDLHWNNEPLGTIRLARAGIYEAYSSPSAADYPSWSRPPTGLWQQFAERARVIIVNTTLVPEADRPRSLLDLADRKWKGKLVMAKPQFGTTATQAAALFEVLGPDSARTYYRGLKANDVQLVAGNKQVATGVGAGKFALGITDTDDALEEVNSGKPVALVFPDAAGHSDHPRLGTLYLPNTLAVVKGGPNPAGARALADYLLRPETETRLSAGGAFQMPLNPRAGAQLPAAVRTRRDAKPMAVDWERAADLWDETQAFLRDEFAR